MYDTTLHRQIDQQKCRNSGIELLKIIAVFLIVISHVTQTLVSKHPYLTSSIDVSKATTDVSVFILLLFRHFGALGNLVFFTCSAWFLLQSSSYNKKKCFFMILEIWLFSIVIMLVSIIIRHGNISAQLLIKSVFPTTFSNNWYLTCYLLFYPLHPFLNTIIQKLNKTNLFRTALVLFVLYICFGFIKGDLFFASDIIVWCAFSFLLSSFQQYLGDFINSTKKNIIIFLFGFLGYVGLAVVTNFLGLHVSYFNGKMTRWVSNCNPFLIAMAFALFNLMRKMTLKSKVINYVSSLSLLIYIIHENIILRTYFRPQMWNYIYAAFGYSHVLFWVFVLTLIVFAFGLVSSMIYDKTIRPWIRRISNSIYGCIRTVYLKLEGCLVNKN